MCATVLLFMPFRNWYCTKQRVTVLTAANGGKLADSKVISSAKSPLTQLSLLFRRNNCTLSALLSFYNLKNKETSARILVMAKIWVRASSAIFYPFFQKASIYNFAPLCFQDMAKVNGQKSPTYYIFSSKKH